MIRDAQDLDNATVLQADVCIAGAGAAGITLARRLQGQGLRVVLLESGGFEREDDTQALYEGTEIGELAVGLATCRVRALGGSTNAWAGWCRRLEDEDFQVRPWMPLSGWPLHGADLAPYYDLAHATLEIGTDEFDTDAITARSGLQALPLDATRVRTSLYQYSPPVRMVVRDRAELEASEDIDLLLHANLTEIELGQDGDVAGFGCQTLSGVSFRVTAQAYVLALGGIENARMLLASNRQEGAGVGNGHDVVGRYFMEHPHFYKNAWLVTSAARDLTLYTGRREAITVDAARPAGVPTEVRGALTLPGGLRSTQGLPGLAATLRPFGTEEAAERMGDVAGDALAPLLRSDDALALYALDIRAEQRPIADSRVTLSSERDALGVPRTQITWRIDEADLAAVQTTLTHFGTEIARAGVGRLWMPLDDRGVLQPSSFDRGCHHMGTTRMHSDPTKGVVDADLRVHGVPSLSIAGSSVYPTGGFANPTLTLVALAHRLADRLIAELAP